MILHSLLFSSFLSVIRVEVKSRLIEVAEGSDVSFRCSSVTDEVPVLGHNLNTKVKLENSEFLLIKNFQSRDVGFYACNNATHRHTLHLELKSGSTHEQLYFLRASEDSVFFFCKALSSLSLRATWSWTPHSSSKRMTLDQNSPSQFNNRLKFRNTENDFSLKISPVVWNDSGTFSCRRTESAVSAVFELVMVKVFTDPLEVSPGCEVELNCQTSHQTLRVLWMNTETRATFSSPHLEKNVTSQQSWTCAVFDGSTLRAVFPLTINITHTFTTPSSPSSSPSPSSSSSSPSPSSSHHTHTQPETPTHTAVNNFTHNANTEHIRSHIIIIIIGVFIIFISVIILMFTAVSCTNTTEGSRDRFYSEGAEPVIYTEVQFIRKSDTSTEHQLNSINTRAEEDEIIYTTVRLP